MELSPHENFPGTILRDSGLGIWGKLYRTEQRLQFRLTIMRSNDGTIDDEEKR